MPDRIEITVTIQAQHLAHKPAKILAEVSGLSQAQVKDAMQKGAVWLRRGASQKRLRRASRPVRTGDELSLNFDQAVLSQTVPTPDLLHDAGTYSVWFKPFGMPCQGSRWGDFASIARWVESHMPAITGSAQRPVHLVHRLDRATTGLMLLAHSKEAAQKFSHLFATGQIDKRYQAIVHGDFSPQTQPLKVDSQIDGKAASSVFSLAEQRPGRALVDVQLLTGRKHQIRRHLSDVGFPIVGDRLYGTGAQDGHDLQLQAVSLSFTDPFTGQDRQFAVSTSRRLSFA